jgi:hypothetical protein
MELNLSLHLLSSPHLLEGLLLNNFSSICLLGLAADKLIAFGKATLPKQLAAVVDALADGNLALLTLLDLSVQALNVPLQDEPLNHGDYLVSQL